MTKDEIIFMLKRNRHGRNKSIAFLMDFLLISKMKATRIYNEEILNCGKLKQAEQA